MDTIDLCYASLLADCPSQNRSFDSIQAKVMLKIDFYAILEINTDMYVHINIFGSLALSNCLFSLPLPNSTTEWIVF